MKLYIGKNTHKGQIWKNHDYSKGTKPLWCHTNNWGTTTYKPNEGQTRQGYFNDSCKDVLGKYEGHETSFINPLLENSMYYPHADWRILWRFNKRFRPPNVQVPVRGQLQTETVGTTRLSTTLFNICVRTPSPTTPWSLRESKEVYGDIIVWITLTTSPVSWKCVYQPRSISG